MQRIYLITLARLREDYLRAAAAEYEKRLGGYCQFQTLILESARLPERPALAEIQRALEREGEQILTALTRGEENPYVRLFQTDRIRFTAFQRTAWTLDGEYGGTPDTADISVEQWT